MKRKRWIALLLAAVLTVGAMSITAFAAENTEPEAETTTEGSAAKPCRSRHGHKARVAEPENAIGKDAAKEITLADAGVSAEETGKVKARVTKLEDGAVVYRVSFTAGDLWRCCKIDALTGEILEKAEEDAAEHEAKKAARGNRSDQSAEPAEEGTEPAGRGHRHRGGTHSSGTSEDQANTERSGRHGPETTGGSAKTSP